ncbi:hypothetical protein [Crocosphaera sp. XPORK-15E]|uniref:hypothetical protein n=1 Tax=Crocosphaera sp. XPORK-15E TaxID=3110247 RepID=UPI002B1EDA43|nr:hypothetical protein [Crocosphaera sp. XPORK-15E]MEA5532496.1 hypothetical protein [Crocosphaera sp. XPORK-15E]
MLNKSTQKLAFVFTLVGSLTGLAPMMVAQSVDFGNTNQDPYQSNEAKPNGEMGNFMNPLGLMHRANLERSRGGGEFAEDTINGLNEAAKSFKEIQRQRLEQQLSGTSNQVKPEN